MNIAMATTSFHAIPFADAFVNIDTTHLAQSGIDIVQAAHTLGRARRPFTSATIWMNKHTCFRARGVLPLRDFFGALDMAALHAVTVECQPPTGDPAVARSREARLVAERLAQTC